MKRIAVTAALLGWVLIAACSDDASQGPPADADVDDAGADEAEAASCPPGQVLCGYGCFDPLSDRTHCGLCWNVCDELAACVDGVCLCLEGSVICGDECVNVLIDGRHCGACDAPCPPFALCRDGACVCAEGLTDCGGECVDTDIDTDNCGDCGTACGDDEVCNGVGVCALECIAPNTLCSPGDDPYCADLQSDPMNCSACGQDCPLRDHAAPVCESGLCSMACDFGYGDANDDETDGCECTVTSSSELCDAVDNDCNGETDESFACTLGAVESCTLVASCTGMRQCGGPDCTWGACVNSAWECVQPGVETDSRDCGGGSCGLQTTTCTDTCSWGEWGACDLKTGSSCFTGDTRACTTDCDTTGTQTCGDSCDWGGCMPPAETCNGLDDDCNDGVDEDFDCSVGERRCCSGGIQQCTDTCVWADCAPCGSGTTCCDIGDMDRCCTECSPPTNCI